MAESQDLKKTRVKLVNTSAIIIFINFLQPDFEKLSFFGASAGIENENWLYWALFFVLLYMFYRFWKESNLFKAYSKSTLEEHINNDLEQFTYYWIDNHEVLNKKPEAIHYMTVTEVKAQKKREFILHYENSNLNEKGIARFKNNDPFVQEFKKHSKFSRGLATDLVGNKWFTIGIAAIAVLSFLFLINFQEDKSGESIKVAVGSFQEH